MQVEWGYREARQTLRRQLKVSEVEFEKTTENFPERTAAVRYYSEQKSATKKIEVTEIVTDSYRIHSESFYLVEQSCIWPMVSLWKLHPRETFTGPDQKG